MIKIGGNQRWEVLRALPGIASAGATAALLSSSSIAGISPAIWIGPAVLSGLAAHIAASRLFGRRRWGSCGPAGLDVVSTFHGLTDEVFIFDTQTLKLNYLNEAALKHKGWSKSDYTHRTMAEVCPDFSILGFRALTDPLLDGSKDVIQKEITLDRRQYDLSAQCITSTNGQEQFVFVLRDISKRAEADRIKQEFISTVSHELRSPLTAIKGAMGLVLSGAAGALPDRARDLIEIAQRNADRLVLIINDILDLEKIAAGAMEFDLDEMQLSEIVAEAIDAIAGFSNRFDVKIEVKGIREGLVSQIDPNRMLQVMSNLLSNAIKFSPTGGTVTISLTSRGLINRISVTDHGVGIPAAEQAAMFDRFAQAGNQNRAATGGTGLGLSVVKAIVESHEGTVTFESDEGVGTTFHVDLPAVTTTSAANINAGQAA